MNKECLFYCVYINYFVVMFGVLICIGNLKVGFVVIIGSSFNFVNEMVIDLSGVICVINVFIFGEVNVGNRVKGLLDVDIVFRLILFNMLFLFEFDN